MNDFVRVEDLKKTSQKVILQTGPINCTKLQKFLKIQDQVRKIDNSKERDNEALLKKTEMKMKEKQSVMPISNIN